MNIVFRVDASAVIGSGHFMRCLTLADAMAGFGANIKFVGREIPGELRELLQSKRYTFSELPDVKGMVQHDELRHAKWLGVGQEQDAKDTAQVLRSAVWDWLVVDHYALDERWEREIRPYVKFLLVIDDLADRRHECDALLDQNYYTGMDVRYQNLLSGKVQCFLGPRYALLREEFRQARMAMPARAVKIRRMLVMFGGADADNLTEKTVRVLSAMKLPAIEIDVVVSRQHMQRDRISEICTQQGFGFHVQPANLAGLMAGADMAIGAGGVSMWERCCLGLLSLVICVAHNQRQQIDDALKAGLIAATTNPEGLEDFLRQNVPAIIADADTRLKIAQNGMRIVDGLGAVRIASYMRGSLIKIRLATMQDSVPMHDWRNHPRVRAASRNPDKIGLESHQKWYSAVLLDPDRPLLIGELNGSAVGVVRFDILKESAEVSLYLVQREENAGLGLSLLVNSEKWLQQNRPQVRKIKATILAGNEQSEKLFKRAGYRIDGVVMTKTMDDYE